MSDGHNASEAQYGTPTPTATPTVGVPTPGPGALPHTGYDVLPFAAGGVLLIVVGLALGSLIKPLFDKGDRP